MVAPKDPRREADLPEPPAEPPKPIKKPSHWAARLITIVVGAIVFLTITHYAVCMGFFRQMEWRFYIRLIEQKGLEQLKEIDQGDITDATCIDANRVAFSTLSGLLATLIALSQKDL